MSSSYPMVSRASLPLKLDNTLGALLVGGLVGMALWGITCVQTYNYFMHIKNRDRVLLKLMVLFLWCLDTLDSVFSGHTLYYYMVENYGNLLSLIKPIWSIVFRVALTSTLNFTIRLLFAHRILRRLIATAHFAIGILLTVKVAAVSSFAELSSISNLLYALFAVSTASELSVTVILSWLLYRSRTGYSNEHGMMVAVLSALGKLYLNSYLATLNAREVLRNKAEASFQMSGNISMQRRDLESSHGIITGDLKHQHSTSGQSISKSRPLEITIQTLSNQRIDNDPGSSSPLTRDLSPQKEEYYSYGTPSEIE
ncbi:hypothetical protein BJ912DRAFT_925254 [Pholiota molesta]|nr:hypothetical protein BJ912DRAFT_925254 [Pholiota molesta]